MTTSDEVLWVPDETRLSQAEVTRFSGWLVASGRATRTAVDSYLDLWNWSIADIDRFWRAFAEFAELEIATPLGQSAAPESMPGGRWFPGTTINYAAQALRNTTDVEAIVAYDEDGTRRSTTWRELRAQVGTLAAFLRDRGVQRGDRVVAVLPNRTEAVVGLLAAASVGAVWSIVAPEFGEGAIVSRLQQLEPKVLLATTGYAHGGRRIDRSELITSIIGKLPTLTDVIWVDAHKPPSTAAASSSWDEVQANRAEWTAEVLDFEHPLWVLFSSGTTGVPKGIVHGHGGVVLEHLKNLTLHTDLRPGDSFLVLGSTSWVVWNMLVSGLLRGATIVLMDGNPGYPDLHRVWQTAAAENVTVLGLGAAFVHSSMRGGLHPGRDHDLSTLRMVQVTGSPLTPAAYDWMYQNLDGLWLASVSGGTDVASIFLGGAATEPVRRGRLQAPALGVAAAAWDLDGQPVVGTPGELVITKPMPSMPLYFWGDTDGSRYRESYFGAWPGIWRHGDLVEFEPDGSSVILGRSDSTLNRNGIRMGPADIYRVVEALPEVREALVVGLEDGGDYYMPLFIQLAEGADAQQTIDAVRAAIRHSLSPRYLPDDVIIVSGIPHTRTGKKLEVPVKRMLQGHELGKVVDPGSIDNVEWLTEIRDRVRRRAQVT